MATPPSQPLKVFCTWIQCRHGEIGSGSLSVASRPREQLAHATTLSGLRASKSDPPPRLKWSRLGAGPDPPPLGSPTLALVGVRARTECERVKTIGTSLRSWGPPFAQFGQRLRRSPCQCPGAQSSDGSQGSPAPASRALPHRSCGSRRGEPERLPPTGAARRRRRRQRRGRGRQAGRAAFDVGAAHPGELSARPAAPRGGSPRAPHPHCAGSGPGPPPAPRPPAARA